MTKAIQQLIDVTKNREWKEGVNGALGVNPTVQAMLIDIAHAAVDALPELEAILNPWRPSDDPPEPSSEIYVVHDGEQLMFCQYHEDGKWRDEDGWIREVVSYISTPVPTPPEQED